MKKQLILGSILFGGTLLINTGATVANAEVIGEPKSTTAVVDIIDTDESKDATLALQAVPTNFNFKATLEPSGVYTLNSTDTTGDIRVFNDKSSQEWSVKATTDASKFSAAGKVVTVTGFAMTVNSEVVDLMKTGATGIVAKSDTTAGAGNTGTLATPVAATQINFTDNNQALKAGDKVTGIIDYTLSNTVTGVK